VVTVVRVAPANTVVLVLVLVAKVSVDVWIENGSELAESVVVRAMVDESVFPDGALMLVCTGI
jgi:hypothetical protein